MKFKKYGETDLPYFILIHGGFLSDWSLDELVGILSLEYCVITPVLPGHGESHDQPFISIEDSAEKIIEYIEKECGKHVRYIAGFSVGAQITSEILSTCPDITENAAIESGCEIYVPIPKFAIEYLIRNKYYFQFLADICPLPEKMNQKFIENYEKMSFQSLVNTASSNLYHRAKSGLKNSDANVLIIVGDDEPWVMHIAAKRMAKLIPKSMFCSVKNTKHGGMSIWNPQGYAELLRSRSLIVNFK